MQDVGARKNEEAKGAVPQVDSVEMREQKTEADREVKSDEQSLGEVNAEVKAQATATLSAEKAMEHLTSATEAKLKPSMKVLTGAATTPKQKREVVESLVKWSTSTDCKQELVKAICEAYHLSPNLRRSGA